MCVATKSNEFLCELSCRRFDNSSRRLEQSVGSNVFSKDEWGTVFNLTLVRVVVAV
jgi:hypothetical protein